MTIETHATYRAGLIHPDQPLGLPDNTELRITVVPVGRGADSLDKDSLVDESSAATRPKSPRITQEEFRARLAKYAVHVGTLPPDFSREDIYSDHD